MKSESIVDICKTIAATLIEKNAAYGDSFVKSGKLLTDFWPDGIPVSDYGKVLAFARIIDKMFRISADENAFSEEPWKDIAGYAALMCVEKQRRDDELVK